MEKDFTIFYTSAPESYDGFGTKTVRLTEYSDRNGKPVREISIPKSSTDWQFNRNSSGNFVTMSKQTFDSFTNKPNGGFHKKDLYDYDDPILRNSVIILDTRASDSYKHIKFKLNDVFYQWQYHYDKNGGAIVIYKYPTEKDLNADKLFTTGVNEELIYNTYNLDASTKEGIFIESSISKWDKKTLFTDYSPSITPEINTQTVDSHKKEFSGQEIKDIFSKISSREGTDMAEFAENEININDTYVLTSVSVDDLLSRDLDLRIFVDESVEDYTPNKPIKKPILLGDSIGGMTKNVVRDGYSRVTQAKANGDDQIQAYVKIEAIKENKEMIQKETVTNTELGKAMYDLDKAEKLQQTMKTANSIIRSKKNVTERLVSEAGMSESSAIKIQQPDYAGRVGYATYQLTNNNASIKRLQERVKMLQKKVEGAKAAESGAEEKYTFDGGIIKVNYDEDRVQILLDSVRADRAMYQKFRKNGYVFSPTNKAFQRKITPQAIRNAVQLMDAVKVESSKEIVPEEVVNDKKYIRLNRYFNGIPEDTIGEVIEKPNMFVTRVKFGDKIHTIDNGFLSKVEKEQKLRFPKLPYNHPLNILDENSNQYKEALAEERIKFDVTEPNTGDEFDEVIMSNIDPHDDWKGNLIKERAVYSQIRKQLQGDSPIEITNEAKRIFNKYADKFKGRELTNEFKDAETPSTKSKVEPDISEAFKGINFDYKNQYELNKAIEALLTDRPDSEYSSDTKNFIRKYSGYGGLDKYGKTGKGGLFEYYTPREVIEKMWALAYKYGYNNGSVIEPSVATGEFLQFAKPETRMVGYEINEYSAKICKILYPTAEIHLQPFEQLFIKNNWTMKDNISSLEKFDLAIGNPPYGDFSIVESRYMSGMGEKDHTKARNYVEYFIRRSLDLLKPKGLLVFIVGAQVKNGGNLFLDSGNSPVKEYLNEKCTFLDAYRLPDSIFERTGVTSEIIVLQKN